MSQNRFSKSNVDAYIEKRLEALGLELAEITGKPWDPRNGHNQVSNHQILARLSPLQVAAANRAYGEINALVKLREEWEL